MSFENDLDSFINDAIKKDEKLKGDELTHIRTFLSASMVIASRLDELKGNSREEYMKGIVKMFDFYFGT